MFTLCIDKEVNAQEYLSRAGEMAQCLRALTALAKDLNSVPSMHMGAYNPL